MDERELASALLNGALEGPRPSPKLAEGLTEGTAYAVQEELLKLWQDRGVERMGYKIALTSPDAQARFGVTGPAYGCLLDNGCFADGKEFQLPAEGIVKVECELALVLGRDVPEPPTGRQELLDCVAYGLPAFELTAGRYGEAHTSAPCLIADNGNFLAAVLGDVPVELNGLETGLLGLRLTVNGKLRASGVSASVLGDPLNALQWLSEKLHEQGKCLRRGDVILTGAMIPGEEAHPGEHFQAEIDGVGRVSVLFQ